MARPLLISVFVLATCGLVYELIAGTIASYFLGDSVLQFSTVIGTYLFSMGIGSYLSKFVGRNLLGRFIQIELLVGTIGGFSSTILYLSFAHLPGFRVVLYFLVVVIGILVGMEIPILLRLLKDQLQFKDLVSQVLSLDYLGALVASILFPLWLVPRLGLVRASFLFGGANVAVALAATWIFREPLVPTRFLRAQALGLLVLLAFGFGAAHYIADYTEESLYADEVIYSKSTPYQRIILTRWKDDVRLFLNGHLQFSSRDEYRYHEALVHPGLSAAPDARRVLVLGGGDGLAVREILKDPRVQEIHLVDLDEAMPKLFSTHPMLTELNKGSFGDPRVTVHTADAMVWLEGSPSVFDFVVIDFPDPSNYSLGKLYTSAFYRLLKHHLSAHAMAVVQSTSPLFARKSYWCIVETIKSAGLEATPYHVYVPSFGEWGFVLASFEPYRAPERYPDGLKFLTATTARSLFEFPADMAPVAVEVNKLNNQVLVQYYESEWRQLAP